LNGTIDYLVRSTDFAYREGPVASFIAAITQAGYVQQPDGSHFRKAMPRLEFRYTEVRVNETIRELDPDSLENLPEGVDGARYQWVDLDGEGLTGVLSEAADAWYYKRNLGNGTFGPLEVVARKAPSSTSSTAIALPAGPRRQSRVRRFRVGPCSRVGLAAPLREASVLLQGLAEVSVTLRSGGPNR
jgi:hypothetical protein